MVKNLPANTGAARDPSSIPGLGRSSGVGNNNSLQYSCLGNLMDRGVWWATVHEVAKSWTGLMTEHHTHVLGMGLPRWLSGKESTYQCRRHRRYGFDPWVGKIPWRRKWQPSIVA